MVIKTQTCMFSHLKIYPGHGMTFVRGDSKPFVFLNAKCKHSFHHRWNPRKMAWTQLYRRMHKKGAGEGTEKRKVKRKAARVVRQIAGLSMDELKKRKSQDKQTRSTLRQQSIRAAKDKKKTTKKSHAQSGSRGGGAVRKNMKGSGKNTRAGLR